MCRKIIDLKPPTQMYRRERNPRDLLVFLRVQLHGFWRWIVHQCYPRHDIKASVLVFLLTEHKTVACSNSNVNTRKVFFLTLVSLECYSIPVIGSLKSCIETFFASEKIICFDIETTGENREGIALKQKLGVVETKDTNTVTEARIGDCQMC